MGIEEKLGNNILTTTLEKMVDWARKNSLWPATFGLACCAIEADGVIRRDGPAIRANRACGRIDAQAPEDQGCLVRSSAPAASQNSLHPRDEFSRAEGLSNVIVGAKFKQQDLVGHVRRGAQHNNRAGGRLRFDLATNIAPRHYR